jgi:hypothetical protein
MTVEMFKVRMQGQYGAETDKRLRAVVSEMWKNWGFRKGIMRGYWVSCMMNLKLVRLTLVRIGNCCTGDTCLCWVWIFVSIRSVAHLSFFFRFYTGLDILQGDTNRH